MHVFSYVQITLSISYLKVLESISNHVRTGIFPFESGEYNFFILCAVLKLVKLFLAFM